ncbi:GmrSD restriction endonuclease domain-containing protein [Arthrobacter mobilis]|uniref:DUF262 domain-containing protein n=1 Tax=Arthrobacter mobilis TaxID=2724944 RepID=A0A7X6HFL9_9MICC|nr:DUF262 domain-containing protein [Arthrobacter mobilis]NKX56278.1 DUF262 domain-containing protein [Arthrobacter mobilis]
MGYLPPTTIADALRRIQKGDLILPAIQREYVWKPSQVIGLFDSIMRGYPIGSFLSWKVDPETVKKFRFYGFLKDYNQFNARHNPMLDIAPGQAVTAMLDGQQRLTSLNIGLRGTYAYKNKRAWGNNPENYPERKLYLNVLGEAEQNEAGLRYDFRFLTGGQLAAVAPEESRYWFPVHRVYETDDLGDLWDLAGDAGLANDRAARNMLSQLWKAIHSAPGVHFYEETEQDVERVLDIFIRVNSAGSVLSYSDLLLSIATAQWKERDARYAIHGLVDALNSTGQGFGFTQDVVLKSGLVLAGISDIGFKVKNFTAENMAILDRDWDAISDSLKVAAGLLSDFGLSNVTLSAGSVLIPIAYYVHRRGLTQKYRESVAHTADREVLRSWTLRSLIVQGVWGSGLDSLLRDLRQAVNDHGANGFPIAEIERRMAARGKSLAITPEQIEDILNLNYGAPRTFAVMAALFPHVNTRNIHHVDHVFPQALLSRSKLKQAGLDRDTADDLQAKRDQLPNLQLLEGVENISKSDTPPGVWASTVYKTPSAYQAYLDRNDLPWLPTEVTEFDDFFAQRRAALGRRIAEALGGISAATTNVVDAHIHTSESAPRTSIEDELAESAYAE